MADRQILRSGGGPVPFDYLLPGSVALTPKVVRAVFDGTSAAGSFIPKVEFISDSGDVIGFGLGNQVAAGGSADVSFFPGAGLGGIRFDTENLGDWLYVKTTGVGGPDFDAIELVAETGQIELVAQATPGGNIDMIAGGDFTVTPQGGVAFEGPGANNFLAQSFAGYDFVSAVAGSGFTVFVDNPITLEATGGTTSATVNVRVADGDYFSVFKPDLSKEWLRVGSGGIFMFHLPTVNPGVAGQLWNSGGFVKVV